MFAFLFMVTVTIFILAQYLFENCWSDAAIVFSHAVCVLPFSAGEVDGQEDKDLFRLSYWLRWN